MAISLPRGLVDFILLGPEDDRRQLQDSPLLGDVWIEFAQNPGARLELLITPFKDKPASQVAWILAENTEAVDSNVAYLQGIVAASLTFREVVHLIIPRTYWWGQKRIAAAIDRYFRDRRSLESDIRQILSAAVKWHKPDASISGGLRKGELAMRDLETHQRYVALGGLLLWALDQPAPPEPTERILDEQTPPQVAAKLAEEFLPSVRCKDTNYIWNVSLNRTASAAITRSVPAVKGDAARTLFSVNCSRIVWAVIDSGIAAQHPAFRDRNGKTRVRRAFDFTRIRDIVSLDNVNPDKAKGRIADLLRPELKRKISEDDLVANLHELATGARKGRCIDWELIEPLVEIKPETPPQSNHGTHVAGILGASSMAALNGTAGAAATEDGAEEESTDPNLADSADGMCPDICLYDFRVLAPTLQKTEFAIIAALQYIRYVNERNSYLTIHGANLSLSIRHDVRNYACGRTPVCDECERLVNSGVVVVAAAGNRGYQNFETKEGLFENYAAFSITDPGNGDGVITVGATHRFSPHTYGVSFFSSRGPTGDGRLKPDLVAPGERIRGPLPGGTWGDLDGTSMAAPHVSGAAAMLMARYTELAGQPRRIKQILCESATDLGRERSFQGHGMLDVLRAFQSI